MARHVECACVEEFDGLSREELVAMILEQREMIQRLVKELEDLKAKLSGGGTARPVPDWVKPNRKERRAAERKKRKKSFVRKREAPT